jgi:hypothetical protein
MKLLLYSRDTTIPKHEARWNFVADLPFGNGKIFGHNARGMLKQIIGGWQVTGMGRVRSNYFNLPTDVWPAARRWNTTAISTRSRIAAAGSAVPAT